MHKPLNFINQRGTAIYMALFFVVLVTTISLSWHLQTRIAIKRTLLMLRGDQSYLYAQGLLNFQIRQLQDLLLKKNADLSHWPLLIDQMTLVNGPILYGKIEDFQTRLNLNNLSQTDSKMAFKQLITHIDPAINTDQITQLQTAIFAWITPLPLLTPAMITIDAVYSHYHPPYHAANRPMHSLSELRMVEGVTAPLFLALQPFINALPPQTPTTLKHSLSEYFLIRSDVEIQDQHLILFTLVHIHADHPNDEVEVIWQSRGTV